MLSDRQKLFTVNLAKMILKSVDLSFSLRLGEVERPIEMQEIYFKSGRSKTMNSRHIQRLASDFTIEYNGRILFPPGIIDDQYKKDLELCRPLGEYWESLHPDNVWGGDWNRNGVYDESFKDPYHFEMKP